MDHDLADAVEILPGRLYWVALRSYPKNTAKSHYFCVDNDLVYEPFFADFGPLNLSNTFRYCKLVEGKLRDPCLVHRRIIHYCSFDSKKRTNAAYLICAFQVMALGKDAESAFAPFHGICPSFMPFRDATCGHCSFPLTIFDCLEGLEESIKNKWFDYNRFDVESYEYFEKVENGDMNWIVPERFLAFAGPCPTSVDADGYPAFMPEDYVPIFREANIGLVVRLNKKQYDRSRFIDRGLKHVDLYFPDGSCPPNEIIAKFLHITENEPSGIAVHCKAGLGRTGTLIGLYAMKHFRFPARAFIGWNRICRPGSILGPQQQFLCDMEADMWQAGQALRRPRHSLSNPDGLLAQQMAGMSLRDRDLSQAEQKEDYGQGERLVGARRQAQSAASAATGMLLGRPGHSPGLTSYNGQGSASGSMMPPISNGAGSYDGSPDPLDAAGGSSSQARRHGLSMLSKSLRGVFSR